MTKTSKAYTIGLDIGTASVGWAVVDEEFNLMKGKKKISHNTDKEGNLLPEGARLRRTTSRTNLWGTRLFDEGSTAEGRRLKRGARRRLTRRHERLRYLRGIFAEEIMKIDDSFFIRLDESFYQEDDKENKTVASKYPLFIGKKEEVHYYQSYPTIYHLRCALMEPKKYRDKFGIDANGKADLRLIYLALHHILKFRGHFIDQERKFDFNNIDIHTSLTNLIGAWNNFVEEDDTRKVSIDKNSSIERVLKRNSSGSIKVDRILGKNKIKTDDGEEKDPENVVGFESPKEFEQLLKFIVGNQCNLKLLFGLKSDLKTNVADDKIDETIAKLETDEQKNLVSLAQKVNNDVELSMNLKEGSLSKKKIVDYETHKQQLRELREFLLDFPELYKKIFGLDVQFSTKVKGAISEAVSQTQQGVYTKYVQGIFNKTSGMNETYKTKVNDFYSDFKKEFKTSKVELPEWISKEMEIYNFLPKQRTYVNRSIPFQAHLDELKKILKSQSKYYDFLCLDANDQPTEELEQTKIARLVSFRIPYYVGPLAKSVGWSRKEDNGTLSENKTAQSKNSWLVRNSDEKITPWNFDQVVNKEESAVNFIERMTNFDTYLPDQKVLPKNSILLQKFQVLNRLTKVKIKDVFLPPKNREKIFNALFRGEYQEGIRTGKVSKKDLVNFVNHNHQLFPNVYENIGVDDVSGIDGRGFLETFTTFQDLRKVGFSFEELNDVENIDDLEEIIEWLSVYEDQIVFQKRFSEKYQEKFKNISSAKLAELTKRYKGWGRFSKKLLVDLCDDAHHSLLWYLENDEKNREIMQLIHDKELPFQAKLAESLVKKRGDDFSYELVEELATSPANKRGIWQALQIVDEIVKYMGYPPTNIAIEFARENQTTQQGTKDERKKKIEIALDKLAEEFGKDVVEKKNSSTFKSYSNHQFTERLQLYFLQNGKDMYTGEALGDIPSNSSDIPQFLSRFEVDHIIPWSLLKNDSPENKALVSKEMNAEKGERPASAEGVAKPKAKALWQRLANAGVLSQEKLARLRKTEFTENDLKGYINRQLVETRQIMKHVATILRMHFLDENEKSMVEILTPKSMYAGSLRKQLDIVKVLRRKEKSRITLNDYHHAQDAYLNAIVGLFRKRKNYDNVYKRMIEKLYKKYGTDPDKSKERATEIRKRSFQQAEDMQVKIYGKPKNSEGEQEKVWVRSRVYYVDVKTGKQETFPFDRWNEAEEEKAQLLNPWWSLEVLEKIAATIDFQKASQLPNVTRKTEIPRGPYSKEGNLKKGQGTIKGRNLLSVERYGGKFVEANSIALLGEDGKVTKVPLKDFVKLAPNSNKGRPFVEERRKKAQKVAMEKNLYVQVTQREVLTPENKQMMLLPKYQLIRNDNFDLELTKGEQKGIESYCLSGKETKSGDKALGKIAAYRGEELDVLKEHLDKLEDKRTEIKEILKESKKTIYRYLTADGESQKAQQFVLSQEKMAKLCTFLTSREEKTTSLDFEIIQEMLRFALKTDSVKKAIDEASFKESFDSLPMENQKNDKGKVTEYGKKTVVEELLRLVGRGTSSGLGALETMKTQGEEKELSKTIRYRGGKDTINPNTTLIHQSITGLYETRIKLE